MKKILFSVLMSFAFAEMGNAQTIIGNCNEVHCTSVPFFEANLFGESAGWKGPHCSRILVSGYAAVPRYALQKKNNSTGTFSFVTGDQTSPLFTGLSNGTYRVQVSLPVRAYSPDCPQGGIQVYDESGRLIGHWIALARTSSFSNEVIVGETPRSDVNYHFVDLDGRDANTAGFDEHEDAYINTTGMYNYNIYQVSLFELGGAMRYASTMWQPGTPGLVYNLSDLWRSLGYGDFLPLMGYMVQVATTNTSCFSPWNANEQNFFICPAGSGCKQGKGFVVATEPIISSMSKGFVVDNLVFNLDNHYTFMVQSMDGKTVKVIENADTKMQQTPELSQGLYIVTVLNNGQRIKTGKINITQ